ncbi:1091_t:CDS:2 [Funneliformis geosporum]|nr:1091_t:CDS:2 [Funneliformis geosporum]
MDAFANASTLTFLKAYCGENIRRGETMQIGYEFLQYGKKTAKKDFSDINTAWGELDCVAYTSTVEAEDTHYKANENIEKSVAEDLHKSYLANHWKAIRELFQVLGFTSIDDKCILSGNIVSKAFTQSCEKFIEIRSQFLLLLGFKSRAKEKSDLI